MSIGTEGKGREEGREGEGRERERGREDAMLKG